MGDLAGAQVGQDRGGGAALGVGGKEHFFAQGGVTGFDEVGSWTRLPASGQPDLGAAKDFGVYGEAACSFSVESFVYG